MGSGAAKSPVRARVLVVAVPLIVANSFWLFANWGRQGYASGQSFATVISIFFNVVFCLLVAMAINAALKRFMPRLAFNHAEMIVLYILLTIGSVMAGHDSTQILWPMIAYTAWFATPENGWTRFTHAMPDVLTIKDRGALKDYFCGHSTLYTWDHIALWAVPVLAWTAIIFVMTTMMLFIIAILADRWTRQEKLSCPIVQLPLAMTQPEGGFFRNGLMWAGLAAAAGMNLMNGLHVLYPNVPGFGGQFADVSALIGVRPWTAMGWTPIALFPFAVGMSYFIPLDLSFSIWFFYVVTKLSRVAGDVLGLTANPRFPYPNQQASGAWIGLAITAIWMSRGAIRDQIRAGLYGTKVSGQELIRPRTAVVGLAVGSLILLTLGRMVGISLPLGIVYLALMFAIGTAIARVRAELGPPSHDFLGDPLLMITTFTGTQAVGLPALTFMTLMNSLNRAYRSHPMPSMLEGFVMCDRRGIPTRLLVPGIIVAVLVGTLSSAWAHCHLSYRYGAASYGEQAQCWWFYDKLALWCKTPAPADGAGMAAMLGGAGVIFGLMALRRRFIWWPLHPAGYALSLSPWNATWYSGSVFLGWLIKLLIMRYGGIRIYRRAMPLFMGIVLGDLTMGAIWSLLGIALGMPMYRFLF